MANANYDVHMMETIGKGEKCVDIQLAVEMLHYATVPNAYDMAVLLSGDKVTEIHNSFFVTCFVILTFVLLLGLCSRFS